jgi:uncharacterized protein
MIKITDTKLSLLDENKEIGYIEFSNINKSTIDVLHVVVNDEFKGKGYGKELMRELINYLKANNKKAKLTCPFAVSFSEKNPEFNNLFIK